MIPTLTIDDAHALAIFDRIGPNAIGRLKQSLGGLAISMEGQARALAQAHIHYIGMTTPHHVAKPGQYLDSIHGGVSVKGTRITGYVRSGDPLAHLLEFGANLPSHTILATADGVMAFEGDAGTVFARSVNFPGARVPAYPAIHPAFEAEKGAVEGALQEAAGGIATA